MGRQYSGNVTVTMTKMRCCVDYVTNIQDIELICAALVTYYYTSVTQSRQSSRSFKMRDGWDDNEKAPNKISFLTFLAVAVQDKSVIKM